MLKERNQMWYRQSLFIGYAKFIFYELSLLVFIYILFKFRLLSTTLNLCVIIFLYDINFLKLIRDIEKIKEDIYFFCQQKRYVFNMLILSKLHIYDEILRSRREEWNCSWQERLQCFAAYWYLLFLLQHIGNIFFCYSI